MNLLSVNLLKSSTVISNCNQIRTLKQIKPWDYHIRFDPSDGRKRPCVDVLDRFKRLNNGLWIRGKPGRKTRRYFHSDMSPWLVNSLQHETMPDIERQIVEKTLTNYWVNPKYFIDDPYEPYHVRHGLKACRVGFDNKLCRERPKILLEDSVADQYFRDR